MRVINYTISNRLKIIVTLNIIYFLFTYSSSGSSGYSRYGIGDIAYFPNSRAFGMGGSSIGVFSTDVIDRTNPAGWSRISRARFSLNLLYEGNSTTDGNESIFLSDAHFNGFMLALPISIQYGIVTAFGVSPYSSINYNIVSTKSDPIGRYQLKYKGDGGLYQMQIGLSYCPLMNVSVGGNLNYLFGTLRHSIEQTYNDSRFMNLKVRRSTELHGMEFSFGIIYSGIGHLMNLKETDEVNVGLYFATNASLNSNEETFYTYSNANTIIHDTTSNPSGKVILPISVGFGLSYCSELFLIATDIVSKRWSKFSSSVLSGNFRDSYRLSLGGEKLASRDITATFFETIAYRLGFYHDMTYLKIKEQSIDEYGFCFGVGIQITGMTRADIGFNYGIRGTTKYQLQKDKIFRVSLSLNAGELWFVRPQEED